MTNRLRVKRLQQDATIPTTGSRMAAGHEIYALKDDTIPAQRQSLVDTGIAIGLSRGTYRRLAARSGMASKLGIAVGGGVINADYTREVKVISQNNGNTSYEFGGGNRIAQLIVEKIQTHDAMEIDNLEDSGRGTRDSPQAVSVPNGKLCVKTHAENVGRWSTPIHSDAHFFKFYRKCGAGLIRVDQEDQREHDPPSWTRTGFYVLLIDLKVKMCFLNPAPQDNSYFDEEDIHTHASLRDEVTMLSGAMITAIQMQTMADSFLDRIRAAGKEDNTWTVRKGELSQLKDKQETLPKQWELGDGLL